MNQIHPTAIIDPKAELAGEVEVGPFSIIEENVRIGRGTKVASNVLLASGTRLGEGCSVSHGAVLGTKPQDIKFGGEESELVIGDRTLIREYATLNRGTAHGHSVTQVGSDCMLMAYSHVAHDCSLGNNVILVNCVQLAGHVEVADWVSIGGMTVVHQFVKIGCHAYVGGRSRVAQDIPPYALVGGEPIGVHGPNAIGLKRRGFKPDQIRGIKRAFNTIYRSKLNLSQAVAELNAESEIPEEVQIILDFIARSKRGLTGLGGTDSGSVFE